MKKVVSFVLIIAIAVLLVFSLCSCNNANKIVGTWKMSSFDMSYGNNTSEIRFDLDDDVTFRNDGTMTNHYNEIGYWTYDKNSKEYLLADTKEDLSDPNEVERAYIDKDGILHIDIVTYKKA